MRSRLSCALLVAFIAVAVVAAGTTAASQPSPQPVSSGGTFVFTRTAPPAAGTASPQVAGQIQCSLTVDNPHPSSHNPGQVNVVSHVSCDSLVDNIALTTKLFRAGIQVASNNDQDFDLPFLNGQANATCLTARYGGTADTTVTAPPGYSPPYETGHVTGTVVQVNC